MKTPASRIVARFLLVTAIYSAQGSVAAAGPQCSGTELASQADCSIFRLLLEPPPRPPSGVRRSRTRAMVFIDPRPAQTSFAKRIVLELGSSESPLHASDVAALKTAAKKTDDSHYEVRCTWRRPFVTMADDWDARLRASYPAVRPQDFDPFANCPQQRDNDETPWRAPTGAPTRADCQNAGERSFPRRFFSRPIVTADGRYAVVFAGGWASPYWGAQSIALLEHKGGRWRYLATLFSAKS